MFADTFEIQLGDTTIKGRRLTIREVRESWSSLMTERFDIEDALRIIREHVTLADGTKIDPEELTNGQVRTLIDELVLPKEGRGISDFIAMLC